MTWRESNPRVSPLSVRRARNFSRNPVSTNLITGTTNACKKTAPDQSEPEKPAPHQPEDNLKVADNMVKDEIKKLGDTRRDDKRREKLEIVSNTLGNIAKIVQSSQSEDPKIAFIQGVGLFGDVVEMLPIVAKFVPGIGPFLTGAADFVISVFFTEPKTNDIAFQLDQQYVKELGHIGQGVRLKLREYLNDIKTFEKILRDDHQWDRGLEQTWENMLNRDRYLYTEIGRIDAKITENLDALEEKECALDDYSPKIEYVPNPENCKNALRKSMPLLSVYAGMASFQLQIFDRILNLFEKPSSNSSYKFTKDYRSKKIFINSWIDNEKKYSLKVLGPLYKPSTTKQGAIAVSFLSLRSDRDSDAEIIWHYVMDVLKDGRQRFQNSDILCDSSQHCYELTQGNSEHQHGLWDDRNVSQVPDPFWWNRYFLPKHFLGPFVLVQYQRQVCVKNLTAESKAVLRATKESSEAEAGICVGLFACHTYNGTCLKASWDNGRHAENLKIWKSEGAKVLDNDKLTSENNETVMGKMNPGTEIRNRDYNGRICTTKCEHHGYSYFWCNREGISQSPVASEGTWDYCSYEDGRDIYGRVCDTPCSPHHDSSEEVSYGEALGDILNGLYTFRPSIFLSGAMSYHKMASNWCYIGSSWQSCSISNVTKYTEAAVTKFQSIYGSPCVGECKRLNGRSYGQCMAQRQLEYCSPEEGKDIYGDACEKRCARKEGWKYFTCKSKSSENQYCSVKRKDW